jgi:cell division septation protein DedD
MDSPLKQRLIGAIVLVALAVIFVPMLLKGPDVKEPDAAQVPLSMPATPGEDYETRELPLAAPGSAPAEGVLGLTPAEPEALPPSAPATPVAGRDAAPAPAIPASVAKPAPASVPASAAPSFAEAAAPAETKLPPPSRAAGKYVVNIGSFSNTANANALVAKLRAKQLPVLADKVALASGPAMRVRVGPYADRATAEAARLRAEEVTGAAGKVVATDAAPSALAESAAAPAPKPAGKPAAPATPAAAPKPAAASANAGGVGFAVQLSAPSVEAEAIALRDKARAQGFSAFVQPVETDGGRRYRVRLGPVADRAEALALRDSAASKLGNKGIVVANP